MLSFMALTLVTVASVLQGVSGSTLAEGCGPLPQGRGAVAHGCQIEVAGGGCACSKEHIGPGLPGR